MQTIGSRPKGYKPSAEEFDEWDENDEDDALIEEFLRGQLEHKNKPTVCMYYASGSCRNGQKCTYLHTVEEDDGTVYAYDKRDDAECQVCMDMVLATGKQFGILDGCNHVFCLKCIRSWRATYDKRSTKHHFRTCPICRQNSYLVIPSYYHYGYGRKKDELVEEYKETLASIPCKHFNKGKGQCPFLNSCLYAHKTKDGKDYEYEWKDDFKYDEHGEYVEDIEPTLADRMGMI